VTERALRQAGVKFTTAMEVDHIQAIKQAVMADLRQLDRNVEDGLSRGGGATRP